MGCSSFAELRPNISFRPTPHRGANHVSDKACHMRNAPLRCGSTLALGFTGEFDGMAHGN